MSSCSLSLSLSLFADPHPGNMMRTVDGKLAILDFGLMTEVTDNQKYGMVEAIAHLINRDYTEIGQDFINLDFIPQGTDTTPIVPALTKVFDVALAGGGAKSINFQELASDLAEITYEYPFKIPPYFALVIRAISVLEGIALVGNPNFAIIDVSFVFLRYTVLICYGTLWIRSSRPSFSYDLSLTLLYPSFCFFFFPQSLFTGSISIHCKTINDR